jgi:iron(III) transport system substrate-binding protein
MAALLLTEGSSSPADVFFSQDAGALGAVENLFAELPEQSLSNVDSQYSAASGKWVGVTGRVRVVVYNPSLAPTPPTTIDGLLDPQWSGKIGFAPTNASWQSFVTALRILRGEEAAEKWLTAFAKNKPVAFEKNGAVRDAVNTGEVSLGLVNHYYLLEKIAAEGASAVTAKNQFMAAGDVGGLVNVAGVGILASAKHSGAAQKFIDFLQSETAAEYFRTKTWEYILTKGATQAEGIPAFADLKAPSIDLSDLKSLDVTQELLQKVGLLTK